MRSDKLQNAIGGIDPDLIARSEYPVRKKKGYKFVSAIAAVLVLAIGFGILAGTSGQTGYTVYAGDMLAVYPTMAPYPKPFDPERYQMWKADQEERARYFGQSAHLKSFVRATAAELLAGDGENLVYSPVNIYIALAMLAETADGNTRKQLLDLLGARNIETLRAQTNAIWNANYNDDGVTSSILASSLWLNERYSFHKETLEILRDDYYASSYQGKMGSENFNKALQTWLNEQTRGLLSDQIDGAELSKETILALATTVYFSAYWDSGFQERETKQGVFHGANGDCVADFMSESYNGFFCSGEKFSAVSKKLEGSGNMWFILPDEGVSVNELLADEEALSFLAASEDWENKTKANVFLSLPKFEVSSSLDLEEPLKRLGVTDCFDETLADFSPLIGETQARVTGATHGACVRVDEKGVEGAAFTLIAMGTTESSKPIGFTVDRPFIFVITGEDGTPMFIGVVNQI